MSKGQDSFEMVSQSDIENYLNTIDSKKAAGIDGIPAKLENLPLQFYLSL